VELGQGARTIFRQIAADALGCAVEAVSVAATATSTAPFDRGTNASRSTISVGSAVADACSRLRDQLDGMLAEALGFFPAKWTLEESKIRHFDADEHREIDLADLIGTALGLPTAELGPMVAVGVHETPAGSGPLGSSTPFYEVAHGAAHVGVDRETGESRVVAVEV
jgi:CO/xanthine dehydrogenase Mo-binding subunit